MSKYKNFGALTQPTRPRWDLNAPAVVEKVPAIEKAKAILVGMVEQALREVLIHVPSNECDIEEDGDCLVIFARDLPMYQARINRFSVPDMTVEGGWIHWPPPQRSRTRRSRRSPRA